jgi:hypothetical protein
MTWEHTMNGEINMKVRALLLTVGITAAMTCQATTPTWTTQCAKITSVINYAGYADEFVITLVPAAPSPCGGEISGVKGAIPFIAGKGAVSDANIGGLLQTALAAYTTGHQVMVAYDGTTSACYGQIIAVGGSGGQCP